MSRAASVGVIGGGLAGLAAACTLAARGHRVQLFEANAWLGGKAAVLETEGFRFDMGPTILILPSVLRRLFEEADRRLEDYLTLTPLEPQWRCFFDDGSRLDLVGDTSAMAARLADFAPGDADGYRRFMALSERLHRVSDDYFLWRSVNSMSDTFEARGALRLDVLKDVLSMRLGRTVSGTVRRHLRDERVAQMVDHFIQYVGSSPEASPAVLCGIAHMQTSEGVWYPAGGTRTIPLALTRLARELGVTFHNNTPVRRILTASGQVTGLETAAGRPVPLDAVVSNMDAVRTYRELLGNPEQGPHQPAPEPACSGVVLYLGLNRAYPQLEHHNFVFSRNPHEEFDAIYRRGEPADDPTCYVCAPARTDPAVAPPGGEALYVLVHVPYLRDGQDWRQMLPHYRRRILAKLERTAGLVDLSERIVTERVLTPHDVHQRYRVLNGAIYGLASHGRWTGAFKPGNRRTDVPGLYLAGGAAHPGPGMPMVLMSGWIAADALDQDRRGRFAAGVAPADSTKSPEERATTEHQGAAARRLAADPGPAPERGQ
jgi:diapolycopene oxygenase